METTFIYALTEPGTRTIRYFGKADDPHERFTRHIWDAKNGEDWHVSRWIRKLSAARQRPDVHVLCEVPWNDFERFERAFITLGHQYGFDLTNGTDGGDGISNPSPETRAKMSASRRGKNNHNFGIPMSAEQKAKISAAKIGKKQSPEHSAKIGAAHRGEKNTWFGKGPMLGKKFSPEHCAKISDSLTGKPCSPETRAKISATLLGKKRS